MKLLKPIRRSHSAGGNLDIPAHALFVGGREGPCTKGRWNNALFTRGRRQDVHRAVDEETSRVSVETPTRRRAKKLSCLTPVRIILFFVKK